MSRRLCEVVAGGRVALERELMWAVALEGSPARILQLSRMLALPANDGVLVGVVGASAADVEPASSKAHDH